MRSPTEATEASRLYAAAYAAHYTGRDFQMALGLYKKVMAEQPDAAEAAYSRAQIQNIASAVVSKQELLDAQIALIDAHLGQEV